MFGRKHDEAESLTARKYDLLEHAAYYLQRAREEPGHPAGYADLAERFTALAIQSGVSVAEAEARLAGRGER